ncbi:hypothetical protein [Actibacterium sp. XHP0104]|uniref:hypothetical protein n=1 Tax=Actibacterium sp. XHP0104 TaxID=2984335 RepID=UPI0021E9020D|nr:hypothetical protein [Actibacterium sp. XHP0104]MCV2881350.1 hypothetical protein [Actibacterium sp. XHP0104]
MTLVPQISQEHALGAAEYVLGLGDAASRRAFEAELDTSAALRDEVLGWEYDLADLAALCPARAPRTSGVRRLETRLFGAPVREFDKGQSARRVIAGMVLAAGVGLYLLGQIADDTPSSERSQPAQAIVK